MATAYSVSPLAEPAQYDSSYRVEVCLHEPLWPSHNNDAYNDIMTCCGQLDALCKQEISEQQASKIPKAPVSSRFKTKAQLLLNRLGAAYQNLPSSQQQQDFVGYLQTSGILRLYPRAATLIANPGDMAAALQKTKMDGYTSTMTAMHQIVTLSKQINKDVSTLSNHKYVAHQVALLYQALSSVRGSQPLDDIKTDIEQHFSELKEALSTVQDASGRTQIPRLSQPHTQWVLAITSKLVQLVEQTTSEYCRVGKSAERTPVVV